MRLWTWMLCVVLAAGLIACSSDPDDGSPASGPDSATPPTGPTPEEPVIAPDTDAGVRQEPAKTTAVASPQAKLLAQLAEPATRDAAVAVIREQGSAVVPDLVAALDDPDWQVRAGAAFGLSVLGEEARDALPKLRTMVQSEQHESARDAATWAIDAITQPE